MHTKKRLMPRENCITLQPPEKIVACPLEKNTHNSQNLNIFPRTERRKTDRQ